VQACEYEFGPLVDMFVLDVTHEIGQFVITCWGSFVIKKSLLFYNNSTLV